MRGPADLLNRLGALLKAWKFDRMLPTLLIGAAGGVLFVWLSAPLPWMLGAMAAVTIASLLRFDSYMPKRLRTVVIPVLGTLLGSAFQPELLDHIGQWTWSLLSLIPYLVILTGALTFYFWRYLGYGPVTAYFSAAPGGFVEMVTIGTAMGGDDRTMSLVHATRVFLVVFTIPTMFRIFEGYTPSGGGGGFATLLLTVAPLDLAILGACAVAGIFVGRMLRLPAPQMLGPMLLSALVHVTGLTHARVPVELVAIAQVVLGASVGCRFAGIDPVRVLRTMASSLGAIVVIFVVGGLCAWLTHLATGLPLEALILAFAPGGFVEMCLIALALDIDVAFVTTHHTARIFIVIFMAPIMFRLLRRYGFSRDPESGRPPPSP